MRKLGLIGGMTWVATHRYYKRISEIVRREVDTRAAPNMAIESLDFSQIYRLQTDEEWTEAARMVGDAAKRLADGGADLIVIGANALHKIQPQIADSVGVPFLHIAECVGKRVAADGIDRAALLGTRSVMLESYFRRHLVSQGIDLLPPDMAQVDELERIVFEELMVGKVRKDSERALRTMLHDSGRDGAQAAILACAELEMVVDIDATVLPVYDSMEIHAEDAAHWLVGKD